MSSSGQSTKADQPVNGASSDFLSSPSTSPSSSSSTTPSTGSTSSFAPGSVANTPSTGSGSAADGTSPDGTGTTGTTGTGANGGTSSTGNTGSANRIGAGSSNPNLSSSSSTFAPTTTTSSSLLIPLPTTTSSSTHLPTTTSTSSSTIPSTSSTSTHPISTSSSSVPLPTSTVPTSTALPTSTHSQSVFTSTNTQGSIIVVTSTYVPTPTTIPGSVPGSTGKDTDTSGPNIGAIIGGIAGGLVGVILLTWLILIPIRKRAALKKEVDWMAFGSENDHHNNDSGNDSIYRTPRAGVGEMEAKVMESPELYQMSDIGSGGHQGTLYSHLDANGVSPVQSAWGGSGGGAGGYTIANHVVGEMQPGQYDPTYPSYYPSPVTMQQQQQQQQHQQQYGNHPSYSEHGSPETGAQRYAGQQQQPPQQHPWTTSSQGHTANNYPFAPPLPVNHAAVQRNHSNQERGMLSHENSYAASSLTVHDTQTLSRTTSSQAKTPPVPPVPGLQLPPLPSQEAPSKADGSDDCALAYVLDESNDSPVDKGAIPGLHLANPDR